MIIRRKTPTVWVGDIPVGSGHPVVIQSMTNTPTADVSATVSQAAKLIDAGAELIRVTVNEEAAMAAVPRIVHALHKRGYSAPLIGDFHYNGHILLEKYPLAAKILSKYRINPGNVGRGAAHADHFRSIIRLAKQYKKPIRIGVNAGSLDPEIWDRLRQKNRKERSAKSANDVFEDALIQSALQSARQAEKLGLSENKIILSLKASNVHQTIRVNERLAKRCAYPLHLGLTEAGAEIAGIVASTACLSTLLLKGIGDTIRVSLTPGPGTDRTQEIRVCQTVLQSLGLRFFSPTVISCPGCGRTAHHAFEELAAAVRAHIEKNRSSWKAKFPGAETLKVAVMGCVVNGPGESRHADIGISLPGKGEADQAVVFVKGKVYTVLKTTNLKARFIQILENYLRRTYT